MEKVRPWCGQPSDRGRLRNRTESQPSQIGCLPYFHKWCGLSANLECRCETCCTRLAENTARTKIAKNSPSAHHRTTLSGYIFAAKAFIDTWKKPVKQHYLLHVSPQYGKLRPTNGRDLLAILAHPSYFGWEEHLKIQHTKNRQKFTICAPSHNLYLHN